MNSEVRHLFHRLADLTPAERERAFLDLDTGPELRAEVESLLAFDTAGDGDLSSRVSRLAEQALDYADAQELGRCGPYRLERLLGSGGMGSVYLGERTDGEVKQTVAVKLLRAGEHRAALLERFLKERQFLALLKHPSIVHMLDAGKTFDGRPYLVMEYVEGVPIDEYCAHLELNARLRLFLSVCDGVAHAHRNLIIHRDLKPSNMLVDSAGQTKLLDFGIAKLLDETGHSTQTVERLLTPGYASPEQFRGELQTTATDVYSLGAVLYKLATGRSPHQSPSSAACTHEIATGQSTITPARRLNPAVPEDVDYILQKALRQEPESRYGSVDAFAGDVRAFLDSKPISARSGNAWYRTSKFLRRYRMPAIAAVLVVASLSGGLFVANRQRLIAERRFRQLRQLSNNVLDLDQTLRHLQGSTKAREQLASVSLQYLEGLAAEAGSDVDLAEEVGQGYSVLALLQGVPTQLNLGQTAAAEISLKKADALIGKVLAARPGRRSAQFLLSDIAQSRMILAQQENRNDDAVVYARKNAGQLEAFLQHGDATGAEREEASGRFGNMALAHVNMHLYGEGIAYAQRAVDLARSLPSAGRQVAQALSLLANAYRYQGDLDAALRSIQAASKVAEAARYPGETERALTRYAVLFREGLILGEEGGVNLGRPAEAIAALQGALDIVEEIAIKDPNDAASRIRVGTAGLSLGHILSSPDPQRAVAVYGLALRRLGELKGNLAARRDQVKALAGVSYALRRLKREAEAKQQVDRALAILKETNPAPEVPLDGEAFMALRAQADSEADPRRAISLYEQLLGKVMAAHPAQVAGDLRNAPPMSALYQSLAALYRRTGATAKAKALDARRSEIWRQWDRKLPQNAFIQRQLLR